MNTSPLKYLTSIDDKSSMSIGFITDLSSFFISIPPLEEAEDLKKGPLAI